MSPAATLDAVTFDEATTDLVLEQLYLTEAQFEQMWVDAPPMWRSPRVDEARVRETLAFLEIHPECWDQTCYAGLGASVGCFAGWTVALDRECDITQVRIILPDPMSVPAEAMRLLGLTLMQSTALFSYVAVADEVTGTFRHPTLTEFCRRVELVTGVGFKPAPVLEPAGG